MGQTGAGTDPESDEPDLCWLDGRLVERAAPSVRATDSAFASGRGCYTTARFRAGRVRFLARHAARLARDAARLGIGALRPERVAEGLTAAGRAAFGERGDGVVRIQASRDGAGALHLTAVPRGLGPEPASWSAGLCSLVHEGPMPWSGAKVTNHLLFALAGDEARERSLDEVFLLDRDGYAIEGSRASLVIVDAGGGAATPDPARGGVAGLGLEVLRERAPEIRSRHLSRRDLLRAREIVAVNAVRGPRPVVRLDGRPVGDGTPGPSAAHWMRIFDAAD